MQIGTKIGTNTISVNCKTVYKSMVFFESSGAGGETRTPNRPITNRVLYQLSHASNGSLFSRVSRRVNTLAMGKMGNRRDYADEYLPAGWNRCGIKRNRRGI